MSEFSSYYISLTRGLSGYYVKVSAVSEDVARQYAENYFSHNWCSIYVEEELMRFRAKGYKTIVINEEDPVILGYSGRYE